jgi:hypothetical protein
VVAKVAKDSSIIFRNVFPFCLMLRILSLLTSYAVVLLVPSDIMRVARAILATYWRKNNKITYKKK